ncbi:MAG TPA: heterodisulfide reductase-related iron-sulfur binding cluster [Aggregatilineales bacterium]|nr:heterodisulfide reductase-related iron-sulfur binding cluster [Aggregatilineales bacterium]
MPFRDTYWNIPSWAITIMFASQALGLMVLVGKFYLRRNVWYKGEGRLPTDRFWERLRRVFDYGVAQVRIVRERYSGIMHLSVFFSMFVLFLGTTLATIDYDIYVLIFDAKLLKGDFYLIYELVLDFFTFVGIFGIALALARRVWPRPVRLTYDSSFGAMLWLFLISLVSGLILESLRLAVVRPPWQTWSFGGYAVSRIWAGLGIPEPVLQSAHLTTWIFHFSVTAVIYVVFLDLPIKHIIYSPVNVFFSSFREPGVLRALDLEDETVEVFGAGDLTHLHPMQLMDGDACTECGRCQVACPAWMAGTALNPKEVVLDIKRAMDTFEPALRKPGNGSGLPPIPVAREFVGEDALWACTTCRACVYECPVLIEHVDSIVDMRRYLVLMEGDMPDLLGTAMTQAERAGNPWGNPRGTRMQWADGLDVPLMADKGKADVLYWIGCAGAYDPESQKTARAMVKIFEAAGIDYAVLGEEERCNCEWARRAGNEYLYQEAAHSNIAAFDQYQFQTIVTHCPHCFNTFANEYPQFGGHYDVVHHSTYITKLMTDGHLKLNKPIDQLITYHDSCYLGRYNDVYDDPRNALIAIEDISMVEMPRSREKGLCCGGGGAQVWFETHQPRPVNEMRLEEAMGTGAEAVVGACPFCTIMLSSAAQSQGVTEQIEVKDLALLVAEALGEG